MNEKNSDNGDLFLKSFWTKSRGSDKVDHIV